MKVAPPRRAHPGSLPNLFRSLGIRFILAPIPTATLRPTADFGLEVTCFRSLLGIGLHSSWRTERPEKQGLLTLSHSKVAAVYFASCKKRRAHFASVSRMALVSKCVSFLSTRTVRRVSKRW